MSEPAGPPARDEATERDALADLPDGRDLGDIPSIEVISRCAVLLMSSAAEQLGLASDPRPVDLDEARRLITALAGLVAAALPYLGLHAAPLRDGLQALQAEFRALSRTPDLPGAGPGESLLSGRGGRRD